jgi:hypothetical protein
LLVHSLRERGLEAYLLPMRNFRGKSNHPEYSVYNFAVADRIADPENDHLVLTEVSPIESRRELSQLPDQHIWMLWLSVNFSPIPQARYFHATQEDCSFFPPDEPGQLPPLWPYDDAPIESGALRTLREAGRRTRNSGARTMIAAPIEAVSIDYAQRTVRRKINFGTQSFYGQSFVRRHLNSDAFLLTDYPRPMPDLSDVRRQPGLVSYNGAKGRWKIDELRALLPEVEFRPIEGMSFEDVRRTLATSSLYVEIGHLPGRDRLPREAALVGTPTVLLARGAGFCWQDFPIGVDYRIPYSIDWAQQMAPVIAAALDDPSVIRSAQEPFRHWVAGEKDRYEQAVDQWIERLLPR